MKDERFKLNLWVDSKVLDSLDLIAETKDQEIEEVASFILSRAAKAASRFYKGLELATKEREE